jgi:hypothetical protein
MFTYLLKTTCLVNGRVYWSTYRSNDLLFDVPRNQSVGWPQNRVFLEDWKKMGSNGFHHQVIQAYPAADTSRVEKDLKNAIESTPAELRYNLPDTKYKVNPDIVDVPYEPPPTEWIFITNGAKTRKVKKHLKVPDGWVIGNGNHMKAEERARIRVALREARKSDSSEKVEGIDQLPT